MSLLVIVGGSALRDGALMRAAAAMMARTELVVVNEPDLGPEQAKHERLAMAGTGFDYGKALPPEAPPRDWTEEVQQGIADCVEWWRARVRVTLARFGGRRRLAVRTIFQPCWRAGRWKSLT